MERLTSFKLTLRVICYNVKIMKAVQVSSYGGPEVLAINEVVKPEPKAGQILVEVYTASINPFDVAVMSGSLKDMMPIELPFTPGGDFAGVISEVGEAVADFALGDKVFGSANVVNGGTGSLAELAIANAANTGRMPKINFETAAALPLVGSSVVQAIEEHMQLAAGQKILIHGGAGGIGHLAIQLAKSIGAYVATTVGTDNATFAKELGADEVIDYKKQKFEEMLHDFDAVYDMVGGETTNKSFLVLKKGGILVSMLGQPSEELAKRNGVTVIGQNTKTQTKNLSRVAGLVDGGKMKVNIDKVFPLTEVKEAFTYQKINSPRGKVVIKIK
ncbi:MAG: Alcohol dehydrogenase, zinc-containing [Microgenomates group bacterium GW2011_GWC1_38_12]|nr:MAG: Alcohol dehydrogenase, zinc-containing [Microgenomates group bacterium GW2011_GWC1_38_12]